MRWHAIWLLVSAMASAPGQDFLDLPWQVSEQGRLEVRPLDHGVDLHDFRLGAWRPMFPGLFAPGPDGKSAGFGTEAMFPIHALPLLLHGAGGAAELDEATHRLRKLSIPMVIGRELLLQLRRDPLKDLLRVRHLAGVDVAAAEMALAGYAWDEKSDPFVRAAAVEALAARPRLEVWAEEVARTRVRRNGAAALQAGLARLPDDADLVVGMHTAVLPRAGALLAAWRDFQLRFASSIVLRYGASMSPAQLSMGQGRVDGPGQLPYELAVRFGNWRVDHALLALHCGDDDRWWLHLGGVFQPRLLAEGLRDAGCEATIDAGGELVGIAYGWRIRATATELEAWQEGLVAGSRGGRLPAWHDRAAPGQAPVWLHMGSNSRLAARLGFAGHSLDLRFHPDSMRLTAKSEGADAAASQALLAAWSAWRAARSCEPGEKVSREATSDATWSQVASAPRGIAEEQQTRLVWRRAIQRVRAEPDGARILWSCDLSEFSLVDLVRLLGDRPATMIEHG